MPAFQRRGDSDTPELVQEKPARKRGRGGRMKGEPSADPAADYYAFSDPTGAMAASAIIGPPGAHATGGQPGLGTGVAN
jgi:hypothetical protein